MSTNGATVSFRCAQKSSLDFLPRNREENASTPMSCKPPSEDVVRVDRYASCWGSAFSADFEVIGALAIKSDKTLEVRRGIGLSLSLVVVRRGSSALYGSACAASAFDSSGTPGEHRNQPKALRDLVDDLPSNKSPSRTKMYCTTSARFAADSSTLAFPDAPTKRVV